MTPEAVDQEYIVDGVGIRLVCGASETAFSFELEGVAGVDDVDMFYSGSVCAECSRDLLFDLQQRAANTSSERLTEQ